MKKILLLIVLSVYLIISLYFLDKHYFLCPIEYKRNIVIRSDSMGDGFFGAKRRRNRMHNGIDFQTEIGTPVFASRSGRVIETGNHGGLGNYIEITHSGGLSTIYGHLLEIYVKQNALVRQGQIIGYVGKTGNAKYPDIQPHLHFEVRKNGIPQDPLEYLE
jgi:murein DD-endopeptidase MepM/ murein hydrolase activator NlpD